MIFTSQPNCIIRKEKILNKLTSIHISYFFGSASLGQSLGDSPKRSMSVLSGVWFITSVVQRSMPFFFFKVLVHRQEQDMKIKKGPCLFCSSFCVSFLRLFNCGILTYVALPGNECG